jgi:thiol-disulfide isomerase/thioredoxin
VNKKVCAPQFSPLHGKFGMLLFHWKKLCNAPYAVLLFRAMRSGTRLAICLSLLLVTTAFAGDDDGQPAPRFRAKTTAGESFNNESIKGKVVLLEFWTTWCQYCHQEESLIEQINKEFAEKGLIVLAIDVAESKKTVKKYLEQHPRSCRIVLTEDTNLAAMYQANVYPIYVVIDREGNIAGEQRGAAGERALRRLLASAGIEAEEKADEN